MKVIGFLKQTALLPTHDPHERIVRGAMASPTAPMVAVERGKVRQKDGLPEEYVTLWVPVTSFNWLLEVP